MFAHQVTPPVTPTGGLFESSHQVDSPNGFTTLPQKVSSLLCLPSCPTKVLLQAHSLGRLTNSTVQVRSPGRLAKSPHHVMSPGRLFKYARQVDSAFSRQVTPPKRLIKVSLHVRSPRRFTKLPRRVASLSRPAHSPHQLATLSRLAKPTIQVRSPSRLSMFAHQVTPPVTPTGRLFESSHQVGSPNGFTTLPQEVGSLLCFPSCPTELLL
jgi:hypothetical protein